jgi:hypothetical protein
VARPTRIIWLLLAAVLLAGACTPSSAQTVASAASSPSTATDWPLEDPLALEGAWTTGPLTPDEMKERGLLYAKERCIDAFIGDAQTITWDLYVRGGSWVLFRTDDDGEPADVDGGSVTRYFDGYARFDEVGGGTHMAILTTYVRTHDDGFTMNFDRMKLASPEDRCFVKAAFVTELTNTFMPMESDG